MKIRKTCPNCKIKFFLQPNCPMCNASIEIKNTHQHIDVHKEIDGEELLNHHEE